MAETITQGSSEYMIADVTDRLGNLTGLAGTNPTYDVLNNLGSSMISGAVAAFNGMEVFCLIDTTTPSLWAAGDYRLYITFETGPETPRLGPYHFTVDAS